MAEFESRKIKVIGISRDSAKSHRNFIARHGLSALLLLSDEEGIATRAYRTDHWLLPVSKRVYIIVDKQGNIVYRKDTGLGPLENQTQRLIGEIDRNIK
jgi:peroxiredoxin